MIVFLLLVIAIGVLLLSEAGQTLLGFGLVLGIRIFLVLVVLSILIGAYIFISGENNDTDNTPNNMQSVNQKVTNPTNPYANQQTLIKNKLSEVNIEEAAIDTRVMDYNYFNVYGFTICKNTKVKQILSRAYGAGGIYEYSPGSGTNIMYEDGTVQIDYSTIGPVWRSLPGDEVEVCFFAEPKNCPVGDDRGKIYYSKNKRTGETWFMADSSHYCGGA